MTFTVDGVDKKYSSYEDSGFLTDEDDSNKYWNGWNEDWDVEDSDYVIINIPKSVTSGTVFTNAMDDTVYSLSLTINGVDYDTDTTQPFILTITEWGAVGGIVKGTFSGTLLQSYPSGTDTVVITNGKFEATNNTDRTEK